MNSCDGRNTPSVEDIRRLASLVNSLKGDINSVKCDIVELSGQVGEIKKTLNDLMYPPRDWD